MGSGRLKIKDSLHQLKQIHKKGQLFISLSTLSSVLGVPKVTVWRYVNRGHFRAYKIDNRTFIDLLSVIQALEKNEV